MSISKTPTKNPTFPPAPKATTHSNLSLKKRRLGAACPHWQRGRVGSLGTNPQLGGAPGVFFFFSARAATDAGVSYCRYYGTPRIPRIPASPNQHRARLRFDVMPFQHGNFSFVSSEPLPRQLSNTRDTGTEPGKTWSGFPLDPGAGAVAVAGR